MGKTSSPCDMQFYGLGCIGIWANQKMSIYRLFNNNLYKTIFEPDEVNLQNDKNIVVALPLSFSIKRKL